MRRLNGILFLLLLVGVVGCDHATKRLAAAELANRGPVSLVPGVLDLRYVTNTDTAFSVLGGLLSAETRFYVLLISMGIATLAIALWVGQRWRSAMRMERVAGALLLGGALGNLLDRLLRGHVIDFIHISYWPVFNVADIALCIGAGLLLLAARSKASWQRT
jgi:signal peptidase II